jgi:hypothetical protein
MANNFNTNPLSFTAADVSLKTYSGAKYFPVSDNNRFRVNRIVWAGPTTNGDTFTVTDGHGVTLATGACVTASIGLPQTTVVDTLVEDVQVTVLSSGTLLIYIEQE